MRFAKAAFVVSILGSVLFGTAEVGAASTAAGGTIYISAIPTNTGATYPIVIVGAFADHGKATTVDKNGKVDQNGNYVKIVLKAGSFEVNSTALNMKANAAAPIFNNTTNCSFAFSTTGPVTLFDGSGLYKGISGTLSITENFVAILPHVASGKNKGQCNESNSAVPIASSGVISGSGKVTFS